MLNNCVLAGLRIYDGAFFMIALVLALCAAGRTFGIDAVLARRWPSSVIW